MCVHVCVIDRGKSPTDKMTASFTLGAPKVSVPVLSNTTHVTLCAFSKGSPPLMSTPHCRDGRREGGRRKEERERERERGERERESEGKREN